MVKIPDTIRLMVIKTKNAYLDKQSKESSTGKTKPKYKLAAIQFHELGEYLFFVFTSNPATCKSQYLFSVKDHHWEDKVEGVALPASYCDPTKHEWLKQKEMLEKINNHLNGFPYMARLSDVKYIELQNLVKKANEDQRISKQVKDIIGKGILDTTGVLAIKLGLG